MRNAARLTASLGLLLALTAHARAVPRFITTDAGVRLSSASFQTTTGAYPALRMYYITGSSAVVSATTADGLAFVNQAGVRLSSTTVPALDVAISSITGATIQAIAGGGFRMLYAVTGTTGTFRIYSATSADGTGWANETGTIVNIANTYVGSPSAIILGTGDWRLYYIEDSAGGNNPTNYRVFSALSTDQGRHFGAGSLALNQRAGQVTATKLTNGKVRLFYTQNAVGISSYTSILTALSTDANGTSFNVEALTQASTTTPSALSSPLVIRTTDTAPAFRWRMYYTLQDPNVVADSETVVSKVTDYPEPSSISPSVVFQGNAPVPIALTGEIFDTLAGGLSARLQRAGQANIAGGALARTDDQNFSATFNTQGAQLGYWDVVVTNGNGLSTTLTGALLVDFQGGSAVVTDNLLRPAIGIPTKIVVTIFTAGEVVVNVRTTSGQLVNTIFKGSVPAGIYTYFWDGRTASGRLCASGLYVVETRGPKLNVNNKVVLIK